MYAEVPYVEGITSESFERFWPFYLGQHANTTSRRLHILGTTAAISLLGLAVVTFSFKLLFAAPLAGYGAAWVGHYFFENNKPATFKHPVYSLQGDIRLWLEVVTGKRPF